MTTMEGKKAPAFTLPASTGGKVALKDFKGQYLVIFFYPKDSTPGCTKEACGFRDNMKAFAKLSAAVVGISILDSKSKARFSERQALNYPLLADEDHKIAEKYGVWKEKSFYGRKFMGITRETFLVGPNGKIVKHWEKAKGNEAHSDEVLECLKSLVGK